MMDSRTGIDPDETLTERISSWVGIKERGRTRAVDERRVEVCL